MEEPYKIVERIDLYLSRSKELSGKTIVVTAGGTREQIDAVRYIGNNSSGKMGYSIAEELAKRGANIILISGKTHLKTKHPNIKLINIVSAKEMYDQTTKYFPQSDIAILSAAVSDFTPENKAENKIKKTGNNLIITLTPTQDILARLGEIKKDNQILIGFALETDNEKENAIKKLKNKNLDFIILNSLKDKGAGFETPTNKITIIDKNLNTQEYKLKTKEDVAIDIVNKIIRL